jgi:multidrug efflux system outer membrane protein
MGLPVQLLANRPDVQEAEFQLRYYAELTNVARTYFYPALTITGEGGLSSNTLAHFFDASAFFGSIIGGLTQPIFQNGLNRQRLEVAKASNRNSSSPSKRPSSPQARKSPTPSSTTSPPPIK